MDLTTMDDDDDLDLDLTIWRPSSISSISNNQSISNMRLSFWGEVVGACQSTHQHVARGIFRVIQARYDLLSATRRDLGLEYRARRALGKARLATWPELQWPVGLTGGGGAAPGGGPHGGGPGGGWGCPGTPGRGRGAGAGTKTCSWSRRRRVWRAGETVDVEIGR